MNCCVATFTPTVQGKMRAAIGKANLLTTKKFRQFRQLCDENLVSIAKNSYSFYTMCTLRLMRAIVGLVLLTLKGMRECATVDTSLRYVYFVSYEWRMYVFMMWYCTLCRADLTTVTACSVHDGAEL